MNREEAIKKIKTIIGYYDIFGELSKDGQETVDALTMAIEALKQVTGKLNIPEDSLLTDDSEACKEQKSKLDLISRAEAIDKFCTLGTTLEQQDKTVITMVDAKYLFIKIIENLPSADRPRGEWIHSPNGIDRDFIWWVCSECGHKIFSETEKDRREFHAYCGRCGADMRGEENE